MNYYDQIKEQIINNEITRRVKDYSKNRSDLNTYYNVGKLLSEAGKHYGEGIIKEYSKRLTIELGKGYSKRNLWLMLKFYETKEKIQFSYRDRISEGTIPLFHNRAVVFSLRNNAECIDTADYQCDH